MDFLNQELKRKNRLFFIFFIPTKLIFLLLFIIEHWDILRYGDKGGRDNSTIKNFNFFAFGIYFLRKNPYQGVIKQLVFKKDQKKDTFPKLKFPTYQ